MSDKKTIYEVLILYGDSLESFSMRYGVPYSTVCSWSSCVRKPPQYVVDLFLRAVLCDKGFCLKK